MSTMPKPFVFVLMPFSAAFDDAYEVAIRPACDSAGAYAERVDKQIFSGSIIDRVYNQIAKADLVVADMSERNPNVFYEVGYAHALGKTTILVTRAELDIPFDLRQYPHIVYGESLSRLKSELQRRIAWYVENPSKRVTTEEELEVRVNGTRVPCDREIEVKARGEVSSVAVNVAIQNRAERIVRRISFSVVLETPLTLERATDRKKYEYDFVVVDGMRLFEIPGNFSLLPRQWASFDAVLQRKYESVLGGESFDCIAHFYFDSGAISIPFVIRVQGTQSIVPNNAILSD